MKTSKLFSFSFSILISATFFLTSCGSTTPVFIHNEYKQFPLSLNNSEKRYKAIDEYLSNLSEAKQISQIFLINIEGDTYYHPVETTEKYKAFKTKEALVPGGMLFFSYNINDNPENIISFTRNIYEYCETNNYPPAFISVDQEGGLVNRLRSVTSTFPSPQKISSSISPIDASKFYSLQAKQIYELGFNMNLAPVSEASLDSNKDFLGTRSFGSMENTIQYSTSFVNSFNLENVSSVLKHFPGNTNTDPHTGLPEITLSLEETENLLIKPFKEIIKSNPDAILMSHARLTAKDSSTPSCLSYFWVTETLRNNLKYKGLIISDDIFMGALAENGFPPEQACIKAIEAGVDIIMLSEKKFGEAAEIILNKSHNDKDFYNKLYNMEKHVIEYKIKAGLLSLYQDNNGNYTIELITDKTKNGIPTNPAAIAKNKQERLDSFLTAKSEGINFYKNNF